MRVLTTSELLTVWEEGSSRPPYEQALLLLSAACPARSLDQLTKLSVGQRDARLLTLREQTFGPRLTGVIVCPACGERLEMMVNVDDVRTVAPEPTCDAFNLEAEGYRIDFRLPNTIDLRDAHGNGNWENVRMILFRRCIIKARRHHKEIAADDLPAPVVEAVVDSMAEHDPQADTRFSLDCPACSHRCQAVFDIVSFFWSEIQAWAVRTLREIHVLASAYGWREADILAMSPLRRQAYLNMVGI